MDVKFLQTDCYNGARNMAMDEKMLSDAICGNYNFATVRFYEWSPKCISLGKNQSEDFSKYPGIDVVRRKTGGRALLHDNELTYSIVAPIEKGESVIQTYKRVSDCLIFGFKKLGIELEYGTEQYVSCGRLGNIASPADVAMERFRTRPAHRASCASHTASAFCMNISSGADVSYKGKKLIGSAQYRINNGTRGYFLQHGSILFDADFELIEKIFNQKVDKNKIATLNEINDEMSERIKNEVFDSRVNESKGCSPYKKITKVELIEALKYGFRYGFEHGFNL